MEKAKRSKYPTKEWVNKLWHIHWTEYYEVFKNHVFKKYLMTLKITIYILYKKCRLQTSYIQHDSTLFKIYSKKIYIYI